MVVSCNNCRADTTFEHDLVHSFQQIGSFNVFSTQCCAFIRQVTDTPWSMRCHCAPSWTWSCTCRRPEERGHFSKKHCEITWQTEGKPPAHCPIQLSTFSLKSRHILIYLSSHLLLHRYLWLTLKKGAELLKTVVSVFMILISSLTTESQFDLEFNMFSLIRTHCAKRQKYQEAKYIWDEKKCEINKFRQNVVRQKNWDKKMRDTQNFGSPRNTCTFARLLRVQKYKEAPLAPSKIKTLQEMCELFKFSPHWTAQQTDWPEWVSSCWRKEAPPQGSPPSRPHSRRRRPRRSRNTRQSDDLTVTISDVTIDHCELTTGTTNVSSLS